MEPLLDTAPDSPVIKPMFQTLFGLRHKALAVFAEAISEANPGSRDDQTCSLMASSVFGAVLLSGLEWLVFDPDRPRDEVAAAILDTFSGGLLGD